MIKRTLILSIICLISLGSCKKSKPEPVPVPEAEKCLLTQRIFESDFNSFPTTKSKYESDDKGRVVRIESQFSTVPEDITTFTYSGSQITEVLNTIEGKTYTRIYKLNSQGRVIESSNFYNPSLSRFTYNSEGYVIRIDYSEKNKPPGSAQLIYTNGNLTTIVYNDENGVPFPGASKTVEYNNIIANANLYIYYNYLSSGNASPVIVKYFGKQSKNMVAKAISGSKESITYTYKMDTRGNVQKVHLSHTNPEYNYSESFTYNCKN